MIPYISDSNNLIENEFKMIQNIYSLDIQIIIIDIQTFSSSEIISIMNTLILIGNFWESFSKQNFYKKIFFYKIHGFMGHFWIKNVIFTVFFCLNVNGQFSFFRQFWKTFPEIK